MKIRHTLLHIIPQIREGLGLLADQTTIHLVQLPLPAPKVEQPTMITELVHPHQVVVELDLRMIEIILLPGIELQILVVTCLDHRLMTGHLGLRHLQGYLLRRIVVEATTLEVVTFGMIGRTIICLLPHAPAKIVSHLSMDPFRLLNSHLQVHNNALAKFVLIFLGYIPYAAPHKLCQRYLLIVIIMVNLLVMSLFVVYSTIANHDMIFQAGN